MTEEKLPVAVATSEVTIGGRTLRCHVLDDGRRVVEGPGMDDLVAAMIRGDLPQQDAAAFAEWLKEAGYGRRH